MRRLLGAALTAALLTTGGTPSPTPAEQRTIADCDEQGGLDVAPFLPSERRADGTPVASTPGEGAPIPVVFVHGWTGRAYHTEERDGAFSSFIDLSPNRITSDSIPRSLIGQVQGIPGVVAVTFDYHEASHGWVDQDRISGALSRALECLSAATGEKAVVIAHSMGGLATRLALKGSSPSGVPYANTVSDIVTFGTPSRGSLFGAGLGLAAEAVASKVEARALMSLVLASCEGHLPRLLDDSVCGQYSAIVGGGYRSAGFRALAWNSEQLQALPPWPQGVTVHALAGETKLHAASFGWFGVKRRSLAAPVGDLIVPAPSAVSGGTSTRTIQCELQLDPVRAAGEQLAVGARLLAVNDAAPFFLDQTPLPCAHSNLMRTLELTNEALGVVVDARERRDAELEAIAADYNGIWRGPIDEGTQQYTARLEIRKQDGVFVGTVAYPELDCRGTLEGGHILEGRLAIHETITTGQRCAESVDLTLTPDNGDLLYRVNTPVVAEGRLTRDMSALPAGARYLYEIEFETSQRASGSAIDADINGQLHLNSTNQWVGCGGTAKTTYHLDGDWSTFSFRGFGLLPFTPDQLRATIRILLDGSVAIERTEVTKAAPFLGLEEVPVTGVQELVVEAETRDACTSASIGYGAVLNAYLE